MEAIASCFTTDFAIMRESWYAKKNNINLTKDQRQRYNQQLGCIQLLNAEESVANPRTVVTQKSPFGVYIEGDSEIYVADAKNHSIMKYSYELEVIYEISSKSFNDLHSITKDKDGSLWISSSGSDAIINLVNDQINKGYRIDVETEESIMPLDLSIDYKSKIIPTIAQKTHVNNCLRLDDQSLAISLFHQGQILSYEENSKSIRLIADNLIRPHGLIESDESFYIANSGANSVIMQDKETHKVRKVSNIGGWVQEIKMLTNNLISVIDADNSKVLLLDLNLTKVHEIQFDKNLRMASFAIKGYTK